jgi:hypothetical protein
MLCLPHQAYDDIKKRRDGAPKSGRVSIVITDIESYSGAVPAHDKANIQTAEHLVGND